MLLTSDNMTGKSAFFFDQMKKDKVNLIMIICNHCPYVLFRMKAISKLVDDYKDIINIVAVSSNDPGPHPEDHPDTMPVFKTLHKLHCDYIYDADQSIAKAYQAVCTPEFYVINKNGIITYHGEFDPSHTSNNLMPTGSSLRHAIDLTLVEKEINWTINSSFGCSIKWKNNE